MRPVSKWQTMTPGQIREGMDRALPDPGIRSVLYGFLADVMNYANEVNPESWYVGFSGTPYRVRVGVEFQSAVNVDRDGLRIAVPTAFADDEFRSQMPAPGTFGHFSASTIELFQIPADRVEPLLPIVREAVFAGIRDSQSRAMNDDRKDWHRENAIKFLEEELGRSLPRPTMPVEPAADDSRIRAIVEAALPDPDVRSLVLNAFMDSTVLASDGVPGTWSVTRKGTKHIVLTVSNYYHFSIGPWSGGGAMDVVLSIQGTEINQEDRATIEELNHGTWSRPTGALWVEIPSYRVSDLLPRFLKPHRALVRRNRSIRGSAKLPTSEEISAYFEHEIGRSFPVSGLPLSREAVEIRDDLALAVPDEEQRLELLGFIADAIESSHQLNPKAWVLSAPGKGRDRQLSLMTGWILSLRLARSGFVARVLREAIPEEQLEAYAKFQVELRGAERMDRRFETFELPMATATAELPHLSDPWFAVAKINLESNRLSRYRGQHSDAALEFLEWELGRTLPRPEYEEVVQTGQAWKLSTSDKAMSATKSIAAGVIALSFLPETKLDELSDNSFDDFLAAIPSLDRAPNHGPVQTWKFLKSVEIGDRVFLYEGGSIVALVEVVGPYEFHPGHPYPHQRRSNRLEFPKLHVSKLPPELSAVMLNSYSTLDQVPREVSGELDRHLSGETSWERELEAWDGDWRDVYASVFSSEGLHYTAWQRAVFFTALQTKGFVILSGISGTGKTKIAQAFSNALPAPPDGRAIEFLTVRPDWRDSKSLVGYHNPITEKYEWTPFLRFLLRAIESWEIRDGYAWFVILDEMNLAHVEHYFAELLSIIESGRTEDGWSREAIRLGEQRDEDGPPSELRLPPNLAVIGTVNLDETTHHFSPKVLDRAFAIELSDVSFEHYQPGIPATAAVLSEPERQALLNAYGENGGFFRVDREAAGNVVSAFPDLRTWLDQLNLLLRPYHMHVGYRVFDEVMSFVHHARNNRLFDPIAGEDLAIEAAFDAAILMKILPKFHGSRQRLEGPLVSVIAWCGNPMDPAIALVREAIQGARSPQEMEELLLAVPYRFKQTATRAVRMLWTAHVEGFAAFG